MASMGGVRFDLKTATVWHGDRVVYRRLNIKRGVWWRQWPGPWHFQRGVHL